MMPGRTWISRSISPSNKTSIFILSLIGGTILLLYLPTIFFGLTYLDDQAWLIDYHWYLKDIHHAFELFARPDLFSDCFYRPLLDFSFMLNAVAGGDHPQGYRCVNIFLHIINTGLLYVLWRNLGYGRRLAMFFCLFFAVHPVFVSAVVWIPGRTESLLAFFVLLSFIFFMDFFNSGRRLSLIIHAISFLCALWTKETALATIVLCGFYRLIGLRPSPRYHQREWVITGGMVLMIWGAMRTHALQHSPPLQGDIILKTMLENWPSLISYWGKIFLPMNLSVLPILQDMWIGYGIFSVVIMGIALLKSPCKRVAYVVLGILWFILFLAPSLVLSFLLHEYRLYLPMVGALIVLGEVKWVKRLDGPNPSRTGIAVAMGIIVILMTISWRHIQHYHDRLTFWKSAVSTSPHSPLAHRNLGAMYQLARQWGPAEDEYKKTLALNPTEVMVHNNLGLIYMDLGQEDIAEDEYKKEIAIHPEYVMAYSNLGLLYYKQGRWDEAAGLWQKAVDLQPLLTKEYYYLAVYHFNKGHHAQAKALVEHIRKQGWAIDPKLLAALQ